MHISRRRRVKWVTVLTQLSGVENRQDKQDKQDKYRINTTILIGKDLERHKLDSLFVCRKISSKK